ncbi:hypothetical protein PRIPAC_82389 [Pristionchus pacificus]|uniref:G protein-coupled receptor n=1 Tax=Pristionchus pacificus TaxID=54126 RepID=A0A2A6C1W4_PRIPA|nr:hypothetical protein PRIPAC_82389 [Pristionchus pacificus]|eukprot:PDM72155.1 G protein-coupled receptor [Pristionchus pacificus]
MKNSTSDLNYLLHLDRDFVLDASVIYQKYLPLFTLLTIRPMIFYILLSKATLMSADLRLGYFINQVAVLLHELNFCFLYRMHVIAPYAALYCDGPICRIGLPHSLLMALLSLTVIWTIPTFLFILMRMHQRVIANTKSILRFSTSSQVIILVFLTFLLSLNVFGFGYFSENCDDCDELEKMPDLAWVIERGGTLFLYGPPGKGHHFQGETIILSITLATVGIFIAVITVNTARTMSAQSVLLASKTQQAQNRLIRVFFWQLAGVNVCYIIPLALMLLATVIDYTFIDSRIIAAVRFVLVPFFSLEGTQLSLIFLFKNPVHRKILNYVFRHTILRQKSIVTPFESVRHVTEFRSAFPTAQQSIPIIVKTVY